MSFPPVPGSRRGSLSKPTITLIISNLLAPSETKAPFFIGSISDEGATLASSRYTARVGRRAEPAQGTFAACRAGRAIPQCHGIAQSRLQNYAGSNLLAADVSVHLTEIRLRMAWTMA
jgi:hypothetical protein